MKLIWLALLVGTVCVGQTIKGDVKCSGDLATTNGSLNDKCQPAPLKCGKWEHIEEKKSCRPHLPYDICTTYPPKCAPDIHVVTEKEWQELQERLKKMEDASLLTATKYQMSDPPHFKNKKEADAWLKGMCKSEHESFILDGKVWKCPKQ